MKKTVFEIYDLYVEVRKGTGTMTAEAAQDAILSASMDGEKPVTVFDTADDAEEFIKAKGPGSVEDFGSYWRIHGWISYEVDQTIEDGEVTDSDSIGVSAVSEF